MDPDAADAIEATPGVVRLPKTLLNELVAPVPLDKAASLEAASLIPWPRLEADLQRFTRGAHVDIIGGVNRGRSGLVSGTKNGKFEVFISHDAP